MSVAKRLSNGGTASHVTIMQVHWLFSSHVIFSKKLHETKFLSGRQIIIILYK